MRALRVRHCKMPKNRKELAASQQEDAKRLLALWKGRRPRISQAKAAVEWGIGDTQGIVWQYLNGYIPLNIPVLLKFARGLRVEPADISPDLARQLAQPTTATPPLPPAVAQIAEYAAQLTPGQQKEAVEPLKALVDANLEAQRKLRDKLKPLT